MPENKVKKPYTPPKMEIKKIEVSQPLLCGSSDNENPYWGGCWEGPAEDDGWYKDNR